MLRVRSGLDERLVYIWIDVTQQLCGLCLGTDMPHACTCKDFQLRRRPCKHIYFVQSRLPADSLGPSIKKTNVKTTTSTFGPRKTVRPVGEQKTIELMDLSVQPKQHNQMMQENESNVAGQNKESRAIDRIETRMCELCKHPIQFYIHLHGLCLKVHIECLEQWLKHHFNV